MTVCIAALCEDARTVVCTADRLWTAGDLSYESGVTKLAEITPHAFALVAGDSSVQAAVLRDMFSGMAKKKDPHWTTLDFANLYERAWWRTRDASAETAVLRPRLIDRESFTLKQQTLNADFVARVEKELADFAFPHVTTIVAGLDFMESAGKTTHRSRLYVVDNDLRYTDYPGVTCEDGHASAAIGSGASHALAYMALARHNRLWPLAPTLLTVYIAKKQAERARSVGPSTDMWILDGDGRRDVADDVIGQLEIARERIERTTAKATLKMMEKLNDAIEAADKAEQSSKAGSKKGGDTPAHPQGLSGRSQKGKPKD